MPKWLFQAKAFARYLFQAKKGTLAHSPFVYELSKQVFYKNHKKATFIEIASYRKKLLRNSGRFSKQDFGTGKSRTEIVKNLAHSSSIRHKYGVVLNKLTDYLQVDNILELGTCLAVSTAYLTRNNVTLTTVEGCVNTMKLAQAHYSNHFKTANTQFVNADFDTFLNESQSLYDLIFIDGNHAYEPTISYFNKLWQNLPENGLIILDDIHWSSEMEKAWTQIVKETSGLVSIDIFQLGLCFKKSNQAKEHFIISL